MKDRKVINVEHPFHVRELTNPESFVIMGNSSYFHSDSHDRKVTLSEFDNSRMGLEDFLKAICRKVHAVWGDERFEYLTAVLANTDHEYELTFHIRYNPTRFKVNGKNIYHGEVYYPEKEADSKEKNEKAEQLKAALRQRLVNDPEYLNVTIKEYQALNMESLIDDLFHETFTKYCPFIPCPIIYHGKAEGVDTSNSFNGELIKSFEWNDDEEAKEIPDLYEIRTVEGEDGNYDSLALVKLDRNHLLVKIPREHV